MAWLPWLLAGAFALGYLLALAIGPRVPQSVIVQQDLWLDNVRFTEHFGVSLNLDSFYYMTDAEDTRKVFLPAAHLQSRPLLSFLAHPLGLALAHLPLPAPLAASDWFAELLPQYLAFLVFNTVFVALAYGVYARLLARRVTAPGVTVPEPRSLALLAPSALLLGLFLVANDVTKAFFLAAHTQMLNLLVPMLAVMAFNHFRQAAARRRDALVATLLAGFGMLAYGGFVVLGASIALAWVWRCRAGDPDGGRSTTRSGPVRDLPLLGACLLAPYAGWWWLVHTLTGGFYNREVAQWHQIVWMRESLAIGAGRLATDLLTNLWFFVVATFHHWRPLWPVAIVLAGLSWSHRQAVAAGCRAAGPLLAGCAVVGVTYLLFFTLVGYQVERLAMPTAVMGIVALGVWARVLEPLLPERRRWALMGATALFMAAQMAWTVLKDGPVS